MRRFTSFILTLLPTTFVVLGYYFQDEGLFNIAIGLSWFSVVLGFLIMACYLIVDYAIVETDCLSNEKLNLTDLYDSFLKLHNMRYYMTLLRIIQMPLFLWFFYNEYYILGSLELFCSFLGHVFIQPLYKKWIDIIDDKKRVDNDI